MHIRTKIAASIITFALSCMTTATQADALTNAIQPIHSSSTSTPATPTAQTSSDFIRVSPASQALYPQYLRELKRAMITDNSATTVTNPAQVQVLAHMAALATALSDQPKYATVLDCSGKVVWNGRVNGALEGVQSAGFAIKNDVEAKETREFARKYLPRVVGAVAEYQKRNLAAAQRPALINACYTASTQITVTRKQLPLIRSLGAELVKSIVIEKAEMSSKKSTIQRVGSSLHFPLLKERSMLQREI